MEIIQKEAFWITGFEVQATFKQLWNRMPEEWDRLFAKADLIHSRKTDTFMDISFGKNQYGIYTQFIGAAVSGSEGVVPEGMQRIEISAMECLHHQHSGPLEDIADTFGKMYDWAKENDINTGEFKIDEGYTPEKNEPTHELYIEILPE